MIDLNLLQKETLEIGLKRISNGANVSTDFLKHCAGELCECVDARKDFLYSTVDDIRIQELKNDYAHELADVIICILNESAKANINIEKAIFEVVEKNRKRAEGIGDKL